MQRSSLHKRIIVFTLAIFAANQFVAAQTKTDSLGLKDVNYFRVMSELVKNMEDSLGINETTIGSKIRLVDSASLQLPDTNTSVINVPYADELNDVLFSYAHALTNTLNQPKLLRLVAKARNNKITKTAFADSVAMLESKAVYTSLLVGLETKTTSQLNYPPNVINAAIDQLKHKINSATGLFVAYQYVKNTAMDIHGQRYYSFYENLYDKLKPPVISK